MRQAICNKERRQRLKERKEMIIDVLFVALIATPFLYLWWTAPPMWWL